MHKFKDEARNARLYESYLIVNAGEPLNAGSYSTRTIVSKKSIGPVNPMQGFVGCGRPGCPIDRNRSRADVSRRQ